jgi:hypothetical protein
LTEHVNKLNFENFVINKINEIYGKQETILKEVVDIKLCMERNFMRKEDCKECMKQLREEFVGLAKNVVDEAIDEHVEQEKKDRRWLIGQILAGVGLLLTLFGLIGSKVF